MPLPTTSLIINADDYGLTAGVTEGICILLANKCVSNATAMMCVPGSIDTQQQFRAEVDTPKLGVHLQLTFGEPLIKGPGLRHVDGDTGNFRDQSAFAEALPEQVYAEWRAQIDLFMSLYGHRPSHIDSHHGAHRSPQLVPVYVRLAKEYGIAARSTGVETAIQLSAANVPHADVVIEEWTLNHRILEDLIAFVKGAGRRTVEVITHPGLLDEELRSKSSLTDERVHEYTELRRLDLDSLRLQSLELASYPLRSS